MNNRIIKVEFKVTEENYKEYDKLISEFENNLNAIKVENFSVVELDEEK